MNDKTIRREWLTSARENMGGQASDVREYWGFAAVELDDRRQVAMFAVEVARQAAFAAVDTSNDVGPLDSCFDAEGRLEEPLDTVVNLFDDAHDPGTGAGVLLVFRGWKFQQD